MQNISIKKASELPQDLKSAVEELLQQIPPSGNRAAIAEKLESFLNRRAEKIKDVSEEAIDGAIDEAVDQVRHSRR